VLLVAEGAVVGIDSIGEVVPGSNRAVVCMQVAMEMDEHFEDCFVVVGEN